jgi:hypothetical protein
MKRYWLGLGLAMLVLTAGWLLGVRSQLGQPTQSSRWVYDAYRLKIAAANAATGPRVLVVAGSSAMFGIDSKQLEAYWHRPVVNLAVNAGLGLSYILDISRRVAHAGDVILMPMEYALYLDNGEPNAQLIDCVIARDMDYWRRLSMLERLRFAADMAAERWIHGLRHLPDSPVTSGTYGAHHLDARGDQTHSAQSDRTQMNVDALRAAKAKDYGATAAREKGGWQLIAAYSAWAKAHDICLIAVPAAMRYHAKYDTNDDDRIFYAGLPALVRANGIPYVGSPKAFMYPADWFFDTDHHLQDWARELHTARLIKLLDPDPRSYCDQK